jgi:ribonuclease-3
VFTHASWSERRSESYERLAFLGDSVLSLAVTTYLYPRFEAERFGAGRLTKIRAQAVSGRSCKEVADRLGVPARLEASAPPGAPVAPLAQTERVLASVVEALIGACYLAFGFEATAEAVMDSFAPQVEAALEHPEDAKSELQELLAQRGESVGYRVVSEEGPPHERTFAVRAMVNGRAIGSGSGRSKKDAEQAAARAALDELET